jgi:D-psicose/D-tagatose/L-ribulose 3-epimerase
MKFGVNTFIWSATFEPAHFGLLPTIKEAGFDGVEIPLFRPQDLAAAAIRKATEANGLECNACRATL